MHVFPYRQKYNSNATIITHDEFNRCALTDSHSTTEELERQSQNATAQDVDGQPIESQEQNSGSIASTEAKEGKAATFSKTLDAIIDLQKAHKAAESQTKKHSIMSPLPT